MERQQSFAFLQWLTDAQPYVAWRQEGFVLSDWIKANGFDPVALKSELHDLQIEAQLITSFEQLLDKKSTIQEIQAWVEAAKRCLADQQYLMDVAGGKGILMPNCNQINTKLTRREVEIDVQEEIDYHVYEQAKQHDLENYIIKKETGYTKEEVFKGESKKYYRNAWENPTMGKDRGLSRSKYQGGGELIQIGWGGNPNWNKEDMNQYGFSYNHVVAISIVPNQTQVVAAGQENMNNTFGEEYSNTFGWQVSINVMGNKHGYWGQNWGRGFYIGNFSLNPTSKTEKSYDHWQDWYIAYYKPEDNEYLPVQIDIAPFVKESEANQIRLAGIKLIDDLNALVASPFVNGLLKHDLTTKQYNIASKIYENLLWLNDINNETNKQLSKEEKEYIWFDVAVINKEAKHNVFQKYPIFKQIKLGAQKIEKITPDFIYQYSFDRYTKDELEKEGFSNVDINTTIINNEGETTVDAKISWDNKNGPEFIDISYHKYSNKTYYVGLYAESNRSVITKTYIITGPLQSWQKRHQKQYDAIRQDYINLCSVLAKPFVKRIVRHDLAEKNIVLNWLELLKVNYLLRTYGNYSALTRRKRLKIMVDFEVLKAISTIDPKYVNKYKSINNQVRVLTATSKDETGQGIANLVKKSGQVNAVEIYLNAWQQIVNGTYRIKPSPLPKYEQIINRLLIKTLANDLKINVNYNPGGMYVHLYSPIYSFQLNANFAFQSGNYSQTTKTKSGNNITKEYNYEGVNVSLNYSWVTKKGKEQQKSFTFNFTESVNWNNNWGATSSFQFNYKNKSYTPKLFALDVERKWYGRQQKRLKDVFEQIHSFYNWYENLVSYPFVKTILKRNFKKHQELKEVYKDVRTFSIINKNDVIKLNKLCLAIAALDTQQLTKKEKKKLNKWNHNHGLEIKTSAVIDLLFIRPEVAHLIKPQEHFIAHTKRTVSKLETVTADQIYQTAFEKQVKKKLSINHWYSIPGTYHGASGKIALINSPGINPYIDISFVSNNNNSYFGPNYWTLFIPLPLNNKINTYNANRIIGAWQNSQSSATVKADYNSFKAFYRHTSWLLSFAFIPRLVSHSNFKGELKFKAEMKRLSNKYNLIQGGEAFNEAMIDIGSVDYKNLSERKKLILIADYIVVDSYYQEAIKPSLLSDKSVVTAYEHVIALAKRSMKLTPAQVYQHELFGSNISGNAKIISQINAKNSIHVTSKSSWMGADGTKWITINGTIGKNPDNNFTVAGTDGEYYLQVYHGNILNQKGSTINQYTITLSSNHFEIVNSEGKSWGTYYTKEKTIKNTLLLLNSIHYLAEFQQNSVISNVAKEYVSRHSKTSKFMQWLPSEKSLEQVYKIASSINIQALSEEDKVVLLEDDFYLSNHLEKLITREFTDPKSGSKVLFLNNQGIADAVKIINLASTLKTDKIIPGRHGWIDQAYQAARPGGSIDRYCTAKVRKQYQGFLDPAAYMNSRNARKAWKVNNQKWAFASDINNELCLVADAELTFQLIEKKALTQAYEAYHLALTQGDTKNECLHLADKAYLQTLISVDKQMYQENVPKRALTRQFDEEIFYHELVETQKLFRIQNDRHFRKLRLDILLLRYKALDFVSMDYLGNANRLGIWIDKHHEKSGFTRFWIDLGKACWNIVKFPYSITSVFWKDLFAGDNFFYSLNQGLIAGYRDLIHTVDYLFDDLKFVVKEVDNIARDVEWLGAHSIFAWGKDCKRWKPMWKDINQGIVDCQKGALFITKAIAEIPLHLAKDVDKITKGMFFWMTGQETFAQMIYHDFEPIAKTAIRLGTFLDHTFTGKEYITKQKIKRVRTLLHFMKVKNEVKIAFKIDKKDRNVRKTLHKETFGLIKSPFQKFKERHRKAYHELRIANASFVESGYCSSHVDAAIAEQQLTDIFRAIELRPTKAQIANVYTNQIDTLVTNFNSKNKKEQIKEYKQFKSLSQTDIRNLLKKDAVNQLDQYYHIKITKQKVKSIKTEDAKGLNLFEKALVKKEGKVHIASLFANLLEDWSSAVIHRNKRDAKFIYSLPNHGLDLLLMYEYYTNSLKVVQAIKKEQKIINYDWTQWGEGYGKGITKALGDFLPEFTFINTSSVFFGWLIPITITGTKEDKMITIKQLNHFKSYNNHHHVGEKIFDIIMWTFFVKSLNISTGNFAKKYHGSSFPKFLNSQIISANLSAGKNHIQTKRLEVKRVQTLIRNITEFYRGFRVFYENYKYLSAIISAPMPSLKTLNSELKFFAYGGQINDPVLIKYFGKNAVIERDVLQYDYSTKAYQSWKKTQQGIHATKWNYLKDDRQVLKFQAAADSGTDNYITVGDVLETFTPNGIIKTQAEYLADFGPAPTPPPPPPPVRTKTFIVLDLTAKEIARTTKVSPLVIFGQTKFLNHIGKAIGNRALKTDVKKITRSLIESDEFKAKTRAAWQKEQTQIKALIRQQELEKIEKETRIVEEDFDQNGPKILKDYFDDAMRIETAKVNNAVTNIDGDIIKDEDMIGDLIGDI